MVLPREMGQPEDKDEWWGSQQRWGSLNTRLDPFEKPKEDHREREREKHQEGAMRSGL